MWSKHTIRAVRLVFAESRRKLFVVWNGKFRNFDIKISHTGPVSRLTISNLIAHETFYT